MMVGTETGTDGVAYVRLADALSPIPHYPRDMVLPIPVSSKFLKNSGLTKICEDQLGLWEIINSQ